MVTDFIDSEAQPFGEDITMEDVEADFESDMEDFINDDSELEEDENQSLHAQLDLKMSTEEVEQVEENEENEENEEMEQENSPEEDQTEGTSRPPPKVVTESARPIGPQVRRAELNLFLFFGLI